uniref:ZnF_CDGSH domain-containing protein n=1 Tax=Rhabditophanes sp. KR3021 TaxID=114890 RepID=A0AC35U6R9_9BILA
MTHLEVTLSILLAAAGGYIFFLRRQANYSPINPDIRKDCRKVVDTFDIEDIGEKLVLCRCWKSKKFPICDGAHGPHNRECNDNTGPVVIKRIQK